MGADTEGLLKGKVPPDEVLNFTRQAFDRDARSDVKLSNYGNDSGFEWIKERHDDSGEWKVWKGFIYFHDGVRDRRLFYCYINHNLWENLEDYSEFGLEEMVKTETTYISLNKDDSSVNDIEQIVAYFGGWVDKDSGDDEPYYPILKNKDETIKPVIHITMGDIYENLEQ